MNTPENVRLIGVKAVRDRTSMSESSIRRLVADEEFPRPVRLSRNRIAWREQDVLGWISSRREVAA